MHYSKLVDPDSSSVRRWLETVLVSALATVFIGVLSTLVVMVIVSFTPHQIWLEYDYDRGRAKVCSGRGEGIAFKVEFQGIREQGVVIRRPNDNVTVMTFNNYHGKSGYVDTEYWKHGGGRYEVLPSKESICYYIIGYHKDTSPNPSADWIASHMEFGRDRTSIRFAPRRDLFKVGTLVKVTRCKTDGESCKDIR